MNTDSDHIIIMYSDASVQWIEEMVLTQLRASYIHGSHLHPRVEAGVIAPHLSARRTVWKLSSCQVQSRIYRGWKETAIHSL